MKSNIIVTGGAGFIGSHIAKRLLDIGYKVTILDNLSTGKKKNIPKGADFINIDLGEKELYGLLKGIKSDAVFHLAGQSSGEASFKDPFYDFKSHVISTFLLLEWCRKNGCRRFVYASSMSVYGDPKRLPVDENQPHIPKTFYGAAKSAAESYVKMYQTLGIDTTVFRLFSVYGPGQNLGNKMQGMASIYLSYMLEGIPVIVKGSKERFRDFIYIDDVADIWLDSIKNPIMYGKVYNLASGKKITVEDLLNTLKRSFGREDYAVRYEGNTPGDQFGVTADTRRIREELDWSPKTGFDTGIKKMVDFEKRMQKQ